MIRSVTTMKAVDTMTKASNIVLVHGAWADGSAWSRVIPILRKHELRVTAVQLPLTSLQDDVKSVERALAQLEGPTILVGHSYGGVVITEAGNDPKVVGLVYVAAFAPDAGESAGSLGASAAPSPLGEELRPDQQGFLRITEAGVRESFAQDLSASEKDVMFATQSPTAGAALGGNVTKPAWKSKPSWYLVATSDRAIQPDLERAMAKKIKATTIEVKSSHVRMLSLPKETARLIIDAAA
jgi:pimeloyl-ACP methyl ester carboxylesterase